MHALSGSSHVLKPQQSSRLLKGFKELVSWIFPDNHRLFAPFPYLQPDSCQNVGYSSLYDSDSPVWKGKSWGKAVLQAQSSTTALSLQGEAHPQGVNALTTYFCCDWWTSTHGKYWLGLQRCTHTLSLVLFSLLNAGGILSAGAGV